MLNSALSTSYFKSIPVQLFTVPTPARCGLGRRGRREPRIGSHPKTLFETHCPPGNTKPASSVPFGHLMLHGLTRFQLLRALPAVIVRIVGMASAVASCFNAARRSRRRSGDSRSTGFASRPRRESCSRASSTAGSLSATPIARPTMRPMPECLFVRHTHARRSRPLGSDDGLSRYWRQKQPARHPVSWS